MMDYEVALKFDSDRTLAGPMRPDLKAGDKISLVSGDVNMFNNAPSVRAGKKESVLTMKQQKSLVLTVQETEHTGFRTSVRCAVADHKR